MKKNIRLKSLLAAVPALMMAAPAFAQTVVVSNPSLTRDGSQMVVDMNIDGAAAQVKSNGAAIVTPIIVNGSDSLRLQSYGIYGRTQWYNLERLNLLPITDGSQVSVRHSKTMSVYDYKQAVPYADWMNGSSLVIEEKTLRCCDKGTVASTGPVASYYKYEYQPVFYYAAAVGDSVKTFTLNGRAYIDFPVNQTVIKPDYRRNSVELAKITGTIDSVRNDKDITVNTLAIKGFASPEGAYANNERLAKGRTEALKDYVQQLYSFPQGFIKTSYEPEDWEGLRDYVVKSNIDNRDAILAIINSDMEPDAKNDAIQKQFPAQYKFLLDNVYPGLRHSDYAITYTIRQFTEAAEIAEILRTQPSKLSLNELYVLAATMKPGSDEYNEIMETAVRMFPGNEAASLNAANSAMQRGDLETAARYLGRAGNSAEAIYARGVLAALKGDYATGAKLVQQAVNAGLNDTQGVLGQMQEAAKYAK